MKNACSQTSYVTSYQHEGAQQQTASMYLPFAFEQGVILDLKTVCLSYLLTFDVARSGVSPRPRVCQRSSATRPLFTDGY